MLIFVVSISQAACPVERTLAELGAALDEVEAQWGNDPQAFEAAIATQRSIVTCLGRKVSSELAARVHRAEGLVAFVARDSEAAQRAFAAARAADPTLSLPASMAPEGGPLSAAWSALPVVDRSVGLPMAADGELALDGSYRWSAAPGGDRWQALAPAERPFVLQAVTTDEVALWTAWVPDSSRLPDYRRELDDDAPGARWAWWAAGGAAVAGGAVLGAAYAADEHYRGSTTVAEADERRGLVNGLAGTSAGLGVAALGLGVVAVAGTF